MPSYNLKTTHFRDLYGKMLWVEPLKEDARLFNIGETFYHGDIKYKIERMAVVDNAQQCNISVVEEDIIVTEPHL